MFPFSFGGDFFYLYFTVPEHFLLLQIPIMRKSLFLLNALLFFCNYLFAQNSMVGDGFGGRGWYKPHNYQVGAYSAYTVCGDSNQLYAWGDNLEGELGNGTYIPSDTPVKVLGMSNVKFYTTGYISAVIKSDNTAWVWGGYEFLPTGFGAVPVQVLTDVKFADGGLSHAVLVRNDGSVMGVGQNVNGELGNGNTSTSPVTVPVAMTNVTNAVRAVAAGYNSILIDDGEVSAATIILLSDGTVKITGGGGWFRTSNSTSPVIMPGLFNIIDIKGNTGAVFALNNSGEVYSFGRDFTPEIFNYSAPVLGLGNTAGTIVPPTKITFPSGAAPIVALSANNDGYSCMALDSNHNVYAWGDNSYGQLGDGTLVSRSTPVLVAANVIDIYAGENFSYILKSDSTLWAAGQSGYDNTAGSIWMNLSNVQRSAFTRIDPTIAPMNLCAPKVWGVVPVKLSNFTSIANGTNAILNWQSSEETNAGKYVVQYSNDGRSFKDIATVFATGSNSKYNYIHQQVSGTAFYRLKMMDKDGSFSYSAIRVVKFDNKAGFTMAPNPANDVVYLFTKNNAVIKSIQIAAIDGKVVKVVNNYNNGQGLNVSALAAGTYILKAIYQNNEMQYGRFIKK